MAEALARDDRRRVVAALGSEREVYDAPPAEETRGGFAGAEGLMTALKWRRYDAVIDASPPFDAASSGMAATACRALGLPLLHLRRPGWTLEETARLRRVRDAAAAARDVSLFSRIFIDVGRADMLAFRQRRDAWFLARLHAPVRGRFPLPRGDFAIGRPPFPLAHERVLLRDYRINQVVLRDEGGAAGRTTLAAAQALDLPVIVIDRPPVPSGPLAETVEEALAWLDARL